jgi:hypothetical protein
MFVVVVMVKSPIWLGFEPVGSHKKFPTQRVPRRVANPAASEPLAAPEKFPTRVRCTPGRRT